MASGKNQQGHIQEHCGGQQDSHAMVMPVLPAQALATTQQQPHPPQQQTHPPQQQPPQPATNPTSHKLNPHKPNPPTRNPNHRNPTRQPTNPIHTKPNPPTHKPKPQTQTNHTRILRLTCQWPAFHESGLQVHVYRMRNSSVVTPQARTSDTPTTPYLVATHLEDL